MQWRDESEQRIALKNSEAANVTGHCLIRMQYHSPGEVVNSDRLVKSGKKAIQDWHHPVHYLTCFTCVSRAQTIDNKDAYPGRVRVADKCGRSERRRTSKVKVFAIVLDIALALGVEAAASACPSPARILRRGVRTSGS